MMQYLTAADFANTIRLMRTLNKGAVLVVEGLTDARVYKRFIDENTCKIIPVHGKENAVNALKILEDDNYEGILVIVDADFWRLDGIKPGSMNLLLTDTHDLETMILSNPEVIEKLLAEYGQNNRIKQLPGPVVSIILENALPIGFLRWIASPSQDNLPLKFKNISFENFVNQTKLDINIGKLIEEVKKNSGDIEIDEKLIKIKIKALKRKNIDPWEVCSGHDMVQLLTIGLRFVFGNKKTKTITAGVLEGILRLTYENTYFCITGLYRSIENWEKTNPTYKVLKR